MANIFEIPFACGIRFYPDSNAPGKHFDDDWFYNRINDFETKVNYFQKWQTSDTIVLQCLSTFSTVVFKIYDKTGTLVYTKPASLIINGPGNAYGVYHADLQLVTLSLAEGIYFIVAESTFMSTTFRYISEPMSLKTTHKNTSLFRFYNSVNDFGMVFTAQPVGTDPYAPQFFFRCEASIMNFSPQRVRSSYQDQILNTVTLSATPYRQFTLYVGDERGVAPWVPDMLNRIFCCDSVFIDNLSAGIFKQYETPDGSKWNITSQKGYPLVGCDIDLVEAKTQSSLQQSGDVIADGSQNAVYLIDNSGGESNDDTNNIIEVETTE